MSRSPKGNCRAWRASSRPIIPAPPKVCVKDSMWESAIASNHTGGLGLSPTLRRSLSTTNAAESLISRTRSVKRNVKRWRNGQMVVRWVAAGVLEAVKGFRRLKGHNEMPKLVAALRARDQQLGLSTREDRGTSRVGDRIIDADQRGDRSLIAPLS